MENSGAFIRFTSLLVAGGWMFCPLTGSAVPGNVGPTANAAASGPSAGHTVTLTAGGGGRSAHVSTGMATAPALRATPSGGGYHPATVTGTGPSVYHSPLGANRTTGMDVGTGIRATPPVSRRPVVPLPTVRNAWTDPANPRVSAGTLPASRPNGPKGAYVRPGNHLNPGTFGSTPTRPADNHVPRRPFGDDGRRYHHHHYFYNGFPYAVYAPGFYNNYGYGGVGTYGYPGLVTDFSGLSTANDAANLGAPDFSNVPNNYYSYAEPESAAPDTAPAPSAQPLPDAPGVGPDDPATADSSKGAPVGPDSLVEAVQDELSRRGYFAGKADSMYSAATKEAIRRFQADRKLPATGRINEATLHALQLD